jgi:predicted transcriptional regulator
MADASLQGEQEWDAQVERKPIVLKNGTLKDPVTGHFLTGPDAEHKPIAKGDSAAASALATRRHQQSQVAARNALAEEAERRGVQRSAVAAVGLLAGKAYAGAVAGFEGEEVQLADGGSYLRRDLRGGKEAGKFALQLAGMLPAEERGAQVVVPIQVNVSPELYRWAHGDEE